MRVRIEAALTLRALAEVDPTCVGGLISYGVTMLNALRENVSYEKGNTVRSPRISSCAPSVSA
ncbi:hypothetical protein Prudu_018656 [Prunus dulcis]|uniref:Uncharacterized protein n=1 Tax=Prunus dulcis TaxID=3755 RepID=A0A4Y1RR89_PRUDU|nr:hypothetical protein Prudu_018656 [Prunus dulcis]